MNWVELLLPEALPSGLAGRVTIAEAAEPDSELLGTESPFNTLGLGGAGPSPALAGGVADVPLPTALDDPLELPPLPTLPPDFPFPPLPLPLPPFEPLPFSEPPLLPPPLLLPPELPLLAVAVGVADALLELPPPLPLLLLLPEDPPRREPKSEPTTPVRLSGEGSRGLSDRMRR